MANDKVYIHELIDVIGHNRANYMHHMTANWSPMAREARHQLCYGVWGTVGTTRRWPEVVNLTDTIEQLCAEGVRGETLGGVEPVPPGRLAAVPVAHRAPAAGERPRHLPAAGLSGARRWPTTPWS